MITTKNAIQLLVRMHPRTGKPAIRPSPKYKHGGLGGRGARSFLNSEVRIFCGLETKAWIRSGSRHMYIYIHACMHTYTHTYIHTYILRAARLGRSDACRVSRLARNPVAVQDFPCRRSCCRRSSTRFSITRGGSVVMASPSRRSEEPQRHAARH